MSNLKNTSKEIYGSKARLGFILPSLNVTAEPEFNRMTPSGISIHVTRVPFRSGTVEELERMNTELEDAAALLATAKVNVIVYACTTGSLFKGLGWDTEIIRRIEMESGIPATTTSTAVVQAFKTLGVEKIVVATPYSDTLNIKEKEFLEAHGIRVLNIKGLGFIEGEDLHTQPPTITYNLARKVNLPNAEAVFISCTDFKSISVIAKLESELKKPVVSSNTATMWAALRKVGYKGAISGYGRLLSKI
ncbi:MAG: aspartate/glutamate racemase family protein [Nitrososphaerales archaeon]